MVDVKLNLQRAYARLIKALARDDRETAATALIKAIKVYAETDLAVPDARLAGAVVRDAQALSLAGSRLDAIDDEQLDALNSLLPWAAITVDPRGRGVGQAYSQTKRPSAQELIDARLVHFDALAPLRGAHVLEIGCFEGIHTIGCCLLGASVTGVDSRMENILKTMARLWAYRQEAALVLWNVEGDPPTDLPADWDVLHHVGVLYHLTNPVEHLDLLLPRTRRSILLDTHVARDDADATSSYEVGQRSYAYHRYREGHVQTSPFAGMLDHAKWLRLEDVVEILKRHGMANVRVIEDRAERNGRRVLIWGFRDPAPETPSAIA